MAEFWLGNAGVLHNDQGRSTFSHPAVVEDLEFRDLTGDIGQVGGDGRKDNLGLQFQVPILAG